MSEEPTTQPSEAWKTELEQNLELDRLEGNFSGTNFLASLPTDLMWCALYFLDATDARGKLSAVCRSLRETIQTRTAIFRAADPSYRARLYTLVVAWQIPCHQLAAHNSPNFGIAEQIGHSTVCRRTCFLRGPSRDGNATIYSANLTIQACNFHHFLDHPLMLNSCSAVDNIRNGIFKPLSDTPSTPVLNPSKRQRV